MSRMQIPNGSFEDDVDSDGVPDRWTVFFYPGGTGGYDTGDSVHGMKSYKFVHPGGKGNGGGYLESDYVHANPLFSRPVRFACKASAGGIKVACVVLHYDKGKAFPWRKGGLRLHRQSDGLGATRKYFRQNTRIVDAGEGTATDRGKEDPDPR